MSDAAPAPFLKSLSDDAARAIVLDWWRDLHDIDEKGERRGRRGWRADRATLRRADGLTAVCAEPAFADLHVRLSKRFTLTADAVERLALVAAVLSHAREDRPAGHGGFAAQLAAAREGSDQPVFSPLRLKGLIAVVEPDETARAFRRALAMVGGRADVGALARTLHAWSSSDDVRRDFAFRYHQARAAKTAS